MSKNEITIFNYEAKEVRTVEKNGELWFVLKDICIVLEMNNSRMVANRLDDDEKGVSQIDTLGGKQKVAIINESGLYSVILRSDKPQAKPFRKWVTSEVLPSIRKTGSYAIKQEQANLKEQMLKTREENVKVRKAQLMYKLSQEVNIPTYKAVLQSHITEMLTGEMLLPLPKLERMTFSAKEIGNRLGISGAKVGRLTNQYNLKTDEYGIWVWDKSASSAKQVQSFRYYDNILDKLRGILAEVAA